MALNLLSPVCSLAFHRTTLIGETSWKLRARRTAGRSEHIGEETFVPQSYPSGGLAAYEQAAFREREMLKKALGGHTHSKKLSVLPGSAFRLDVFACPSKDRKFEREKESTFSSWSANEQSFISVNPLSNIWLLFPLKKFLLKKFGGLRAPQS